MSQRRKRNGIGAVLGAIVFCMGAVSIGCNAIQQPMQVEELSGVNKAVLHDAAWFGAAGGTLNAGSYTLVVPANAVSQTTYFELQQMNAGQWPVELEPHGAQFAVPVTLMMDAMGEPDPSSMSVAWWNPSSGQWEDQPSSHSGDVVSAQLSHFSRYTLH